MVFFIFKKSSLKHYIIKRIIRIRVVKKGELFNRHRCWCHRHFITARYQSDNRHRWIIGQENHALLFHQGTSNQNHISNHQICTRCNNENHTCSIRNQQYSFHHLFKNDNALYKIHRFILWDQKEFCNRQYFNRNYPDLYFNNFNSCSNRDGCTQSNECFYSDFC